jgi:hypothetical protein
VARLLFRWLSYGQADKLRSGQPGVLLTSGEFIEGGFKGIEKGQIKISSVLLGLRQFDLNNEVVAVSLRKPSQELPQYEVKTLDGSVWLGAVLHIETSHIIIEDRSLGPRTIPLHEVLEVRQRVKKG